MRIQGLILLAVVCILASCGVLQKTKSLVGLGPNEIKSIGLLASDEARHASVIEIAFAYGDASVAVVVSADAGQWFAERKGYCSSYGSELDVVRIELPPGYSVSLNELPKNYKEANAIFVFVETVGKSDITLLKTPWLVIENGDITVRSGPPGKKRSSNKKRDKKSKNRPNRGKQRPC
jgi:hypothetical protein|tara:strand:+ start:576 stop:1109 length:534 start_codon:yes stop_codon:yes gene_type:complete